MTVVLNALAAAVRPVIQRNIMQALQDNGGKFDGCYMPGSYSGDSIELLDQIGVGGYQERQGKNQDTPNFDLPHRKRWIYPTLTPEYGHLFDENYDLHKLEDTENAHSLEVKSIMRRAKDDAFVSAFFADAAIGRMGRDTVSFQPKMIMADAKFGATAEFLGLTPAKLHRSRTIFETLDIDIDHETLFMAAPSYVYEGYIGKEKVANSDYNQQRLFEKGKVDSQMDINFISYNRLPEYYDDVLGKTFIQCPIWCKSGMHLGTWKEPKVKLAENVGKKFDTQLYVYGKFGATRVEEKKVIMLLIEKDATEVTAADFSF